MTQTSLEGFRTPETGTTRRPSPAPSNPRPFRLSLRVAEAPAAIEPEPLRSSEDVVSRLRATIGRADREMFVILHLNVKNEVLAAELSSLGSIDSSAVYPREVMRSALAHGSAALIFAHNHPSGDPEPSLCDREITRDLILAARLLQIKVLDHVITTPGRRYFSFADQGLIDDLDRAAEDLTGHIREAGRVAERRSPWLRLGRAVVIPHDPAKSRRPTGAIYSAAWPRAARKSREAYEAAAWARRAIREDRETWARKKTTEELKAEALALFEAVEIAECFGMSDLRDREAIEAELYRRGVLCHEARTLTFEETAPEIREDRAPYALGAAGPAPRVESRTFHTTPAFPRTLRGPRGGHALAPTPCADCVAFRSCRPGACSAPFGCDSWVDFDGRRVDLEADNARLLAAIEAREAAADLTPEEAEATFEPDDDPRPLPDEDLEASGYAGPLRPDDDRGPVWPPAADACPDALEPDPGRQPDLGPLFAVKSPSCYYGDPFWLSTRYPGTCRKCGRHIRRGERAFYFPKGKALFCSDGCGPEASARFDAERADEDFVNGIGGGWN